MFVDARSLSEGSVIEADICVVGAGAAGITFAREFIGTGIRVAVLESGGLDPDDTTQSLYEGRNVGLPSIDLDVGRLRYFGGTTNHWAGHCRPLDAIDFARRDWMPMSGWPITRDDLDPFYLRAWPICELPEPENFEFAILASKLGVSGLPLDKQKLESIAYGQSPPTRFGEKYRDELAKAQNVVVYLNANLLALESDAEAKTVTGASVACIDGPRLKVTARQFVLATGGMENARLLLLSNGSAPAGLGNQYDLVGRFFQDHIRLRPGALVVVTDPEADLSLYDTPQDIDGGQMFAVLTAPDELVERERLNRFRIHLVSPVLSPAHGVGSLKALIGSLQEGEFDGLMAHLGNIVGDLDGIASDAYRRITGAESQNRPAYITVEAGVVVEPTPYAESRITLSDERDLLGQNRIDVDWRLAEQDLRSAKRAVELAALEIGRIGLGRAHGDLLEDGSQWPDHMDVSNHHSGTTRMSDDPKNGVVDRDCRVHGMSNLYLAGSSVFPNIGFANPTLTIVALSLRLTDHLKSANG
jgi:choline dehydrogenase-like flavoprotein